MKDAVDEEIEEAVEAERDRIVEFLKAVYSASTHGASSLMDRAIEAIAGNDMNNPDRIANPTA